MTGKKNSSSSWWATLCFSSAFFVGCWLVKNADAQFQDQSPRPILFSDGKTLAEVILDENGTMVHCRLHELEEDADAEPLIKGSGLPVKYPNFKGMLQLINECTRLEVPYQNVTVAAPILNATDAVNWSPWSLWNGIIPGTKWCGIGDIADSFEQLGPEVDVDMCCRAHDHCPVKLKAFRSGYGLLNLSLYTKSHCDCDKEFYGCLKQAGNKLSETVGNFYFNFLKVQCIKEQRSFICVENRTEIDGGQQCVKWSADPYNKKMQVTIAQLEF